MNAFSHNLNQVTYPRMERQDLTQGQLGSFKFTPTDEVRHNFSTTSPTLAQQFTHLPAKEIRAGKPYNFSDSTPSQECSTLEPSPATISPTRFDSSFFDTYIKPDLAKSRLVLGPTALRAAVDGSPTSPQRQAFNHRSCPPRLSIDTLQARLSMSELNGNKVYSNSSVDPFPTFVPAAANANPTPSQINLSTLQASLIRALSAEQEAHQATKHALEIEKSRRLKAEAEALKHLEHNRSLIGSVNMLKSIVQHSVKKEEQTIQKIETERFYNEVNKAPPAPTLLHDAVRNLRKPEAKPTTKSVEPSSEAVVDNNDLFNFDLAVTMGSSSLKKHFSTPPPGSKTQDVEKSRKGSLAKPNGDGADKRDKSDETWISDETVVEQKSGESIPAFKVPSALQVEPKSNPKPVFETSEKLMAMPFDPHVQWVRDSVFDDQQDKFSRLGQQVSIFSKHPVRFLPNKSNKNIYRTVMMDFIPLNTTYKDVLATIQGGMVESIQLFGPIGRSTAFMTARIVFDYESGARVVYMRGQSPGIFIKEKRIRVWQVLEATYPRTSIMEDKIFEQGYTRLLLIEHAVQESVDKLAAKLAPQIEAGFVIEIGKAHDGLPMVEFTSVAECSRALEQLMDDRDFGGSRFDFEDDPCIDPY